AYGAYVDDVPAEILEQNNAMTLFGLHRRLRGAALGHLAAFEVTSSLPSRRIAQGLRRLGPPGEMGAHFGAHPGGGGAPPRGGRGGRRGARAARGAPDLRLADGRGAEPGRRRVPRRVQLP